MKKGERAALDTRLNLAKLCSKTMIHIGETASALKLKGYRISAYRFS